MKKSFPLWPWLRRCRYVLLLLLTAAPILLMLLGSYAPHLLRECAVIALACVALSALALAVPGKWRILTAALGLCLLILLSGALLPIASERMLLIIPLFACAALIVAPSLASVRSEAEMTPMFYAIGIALHLYSQVVHYVNLRAGSSPYEPVAGAMTLTFVLYLILLLLSMNRISLENATMARRRLPQSMVRFNTLLTLGFILLSLVLAAVPAIARGIAASWFGLVAVIRFVGNLIKSLFPSGVPDGGMGGGAPMGALMPIPEVTEPSPFAVFMQNLLGLLAAIFIVYCLILLAIRVIRLMLRLIRMTLKRLRHYVNAASGDYDDEITDTREENALRETQVSLLRRRRREPVYEKTPSGAIRRQYARLLRGHPKWTNASTARDNLPPDAAPLYERARYSDHEVTQEDAQRFTGTTKNL